MTSREVYVSVDIETDGPIPAINSMLSFGAAAFDGKSEEPFATFSANLETLPGAQGDPSTLAWWKTQPDAWEACRKDLQAPEAAMQAFHHWLKCLEGTPTFVGYPATFDHSFIHWYLIRFAGEDPFGFSSIDIKTYAWAKLGTKTYRETTKKAMPRRWFPKDRRHTHVALDDAIEQGILFTRMRAT